MIEDVVRDRQRYRHAHRAQSVADSLAGPQTLMGPMIHSACVESWNVQRPARARSAAPPSSGANFCSPPCPRQLQPERSERGHGRARTGPAQGQHLQPARRTSTAQWGPGWPALLGAVQHRQGLAPAVRRTHCDGGGGRCAGDSHGAGVAEVDAQALGPQARHLPPHLQARGLHASAARIACAARPKPLHAGAGPGIGGHASSLSIVPLGGQHRCDRCTGSWPHPSFNGALFAVTERTWGAPRALTAQWRLSSLATTAAARHVQSPSRRICAGSYDRGHPHLSLRPRSAPATARLRRQLWRGLCGPGEPLHPGRPRHQIRFAVHRPDLCGRGPV
jgi:inner membrane protein